MSGGWLWLRSHTSLVSSYIAQTSLMLMRCVDSARSAPTTPTNTFRPTERGETCQRRSSGLGHTSRWHGVGLSGVSCNVTWHCACFSVEDFFLPFSLLKALSLEQKARGNLSLTLDRCKNLTSSNTSHRPCYVGFHFL